MTDAEHALLMHTCRCICALLVKHAEPNTHAEWLLAKMDEQLRAVRLETRLAESSVA